MSSVFGQKARSVRQRPPQGCTTRQIGGHIPFFFVLVPLLLQLIIVQYFLLMRSLHEKGCMWSFQCHALNYSLPPTRYSFVLQLMDLNTWFNVQQAAIQSILSPDTMARDAVSDYLKVS